MNPQPLKPVEIEGATVVITHRINASQQADYERWMAEISTRCREAPGFLDSHAVRPIPGLTETYTIIIRFDTEAHLRQWMGSPERQQLIDRAEPMLAGTGAVHISSGLDFWFVPPAPRLKAPVRWKQALLTWSAIFPLVYVVPPLLVPALQALGLPLHRALVTLVATGVIVLLMVYLVMPRYTRLVQRWLFR